MVWGLAGLEDGGLRGGACLPGRRVMVSEGSVLDGIVLAGKRRSVNTGSYQEGRWLTSFEVWKTW